MTQPMTHATIYHIDAARMAVEFDYEEQLKNTIAAMPGADWQKSSKRWLLPVARLGDVVKLFWPNVTIDYDVMRARDAQLRRMFRQYIAMGVKFRIDNGRVTCDHEALNAYFAKCATILHTQALESVLAEQTGKAAKSSQAPQPAIEEDPKLALWLRGVKNAMVAEERKKAIVANRRKVTA